MEVKTKEEAEARAQARKEADREENRERRRALEAAQEAREASKARQDALRAEFEQRVDMKRLLKNASPWEKGSEPLDKEAKEELKRTLKRSSSMPDMAEELAGTQPPSSSLGDAKENRPSRLPKTPPPLKRAATSGSGSFSTTKEMLSKSLAEALDSFRSSLSGMSLSARYAHSPEKETYVNCCYSER